MIKLRDSNGNISTIKDNGDMEFDNNKIEEQYKHAENKTNKDCKGGE